MSDTDDGGVRVTRIGNWEVSSATAISEHGASRAVYISDGTETMITTKPADQLLVALAHHLGVDHWDAQT